MNKKLSDATRHNTHRNSEKLENATTNKIIKSTCSIKMSIVQVASFGYERIVVIPGTQSVKNFGSVR